jgi:hypothetical protein
MSIQGMARSGAEGAGRYYRNILKARWIRSRSLADDEVCAVSTA